MEGPLHSLGIGDLLHHGCSVRTNAMYPQIMMAHLEKASEYAINALHQVWLDTYSTGQLRSCANLDAMLMILMLGLSSKPQQQR